MAQVIEVTEKSVNGKTHKTPITKYYNTGLIENTNAVDASGTNDCEIFLAGRATKDIRRVDETQAQILALINTPPTTDVEKGVSLTVKARGGQLESNTTPYVRTFGKTSIIEFFADPNDSGDSFVVTRYGKNNAERQIWLVDDIATDIRDKFLL